MLHIIWYALIKYNWVYLMNIGRYVYEYKYAKTIV